MEEYQINDSTMPPIDPVMMGAPEENNKKKTIIVASIAGVVILVAAILGIVSIVSSVNSKKPIEEAISSQETKKEEESSVAENQGEISPADKYDESKFKGETEPAKDAPVISDVKDTDEVPSTGPADFAIIAIFAGIAAALVAKNIELSKRF